MAARTTRARRRTRVRHGRPRPRADRHPGVAAPAGGGRRLATEPAARRAGRGLDVGDRRARRSRTRSHAWSAASSPASSSCPLRHSATIRAQSGSVPCCSSSGETPRARAGSTPRGRIPTICASTGWRPGAPEPSSARHVATADPAWRRSLAGPLGELGVSTGRVRDLDVLIADVQAELASSTRSTAPRRPARRDVGARARASTTRSARDAGRRTDTAPCSAAYVTAQALAGRSKRSRSPRSPARSSSGCRKHVRRLGDHPDEAALHSLRIALKRARYAAELSAPRASAATRFLADAKALQDLLGEHQDGAVAEQQLRAATVLDSRPGRPSSPDGSPSGDARIA